MVPAMRLLLGLAVFFAAPVPALAATENVKVDDDFFDLTDTTADVGDTVNWHWDGSNDHTVTTHRRQIDRFNSGIHNKGFRFSHQFNYPGRFRYFCEIHPGIMEATVTVGTDDGVPPSFSSVRRRVSGHKVKLSFVVSERSVVTVRVTRKKKVTRTFNAGKHAVRFRHLHAGRYKARFAAVDGFGHKGTASKRFRIR
jgi:plastocyanin